MPVSSRRAVERLDVADRGLVFDPFDRSLRPIVDAPLMRLIA